MSRPYGCQDKAPRKTLPLETRFWAKVCRRGPDECWPWTGCVNSFGYGQLQRGRRGSGRISAPRLSWELHHGQIPKGAYVCHRCDVPGCVNPQHLFLGTPSDNARDCVSKGRHRTLRGERSSKAKLSEEDVAEIRRSEESHAELGRRFGVNAVTILHARARQTWEHVP